MNPEPTTEASPLIGERVLRGRKRPWSIRVHTRSAVVTTALVIAVAVLIVISMLVGDYRVSLGGMIDTIFGRPPAPLTHFFVIERRLPRALVAVIVGAALATAGALFQATTRNPLASPDIIGITGGASVGAVLVLLVLGGTLAQASIGAIAGALIAAAVIMTLSSRGNLSGTRLVLVGVAIGAIANAAVAYLLSQVFVASAVTTQTWLIGSLQGRGWNYVLPALVGTLLVVPVVWRYAGALRILELGDETAISLGIRVHRVRRTLLIAGTLLAAIAVATAGPIAFIALVAPHLARRLTHTSHLLPTALIGALLLGTGDLIAQYAFGVAIPVGVVTVTTGGVFFLWILWNEGRTRRA